MLIKAKKLVFLKNRLRKKLLLKCEHQSEKTKKARDTRIIKKIEKLPVFRRAKRFFSYLSHRGEVSTDPLLKKNLGIKKIYVPKVAGKKVRLFELKRFDELAQGRFGIREHPDVTRAPALRNFSTLDCAFIPGVAFDFRGHRIGYGGGYFDRLLPKLRCTTIGLAYEFQIVDKAPQAPYDIPVDFIVTEKRIICCNKKAHATAGSPAKRGTQKLLSR